MIEKKVAIALMARDCAKSLQNNIPEIEKQCEFEKFVEQSDKSKFALQQTLDALNKTYKKIIAENIG